MPPLYTGNKTCTRCGVTLPVEDFGLDRRGYLIPHCRPCRAAHVKQMRLNKLDEYRERAKQRSREFLADFPETAREKGREWYRKNNARAHEHRRKTRYGLRFGGFLALLEQQHNRCAICGVEFDSQCKPHVDHDHSIKRPRGILCKTCNLGLGGLRDSSKLLRAAADYIDYWSAEYSYLK